MTNILDIFIMLAVVFATLPPIDKVFVFFVYWMIIVWLVAYAIFGGRA